MTSPLEGATSLSRRSLATLCAEGVEALTVAMSVAPGVFTRNRMFELFTLPTTQRARARAATLRGVLRQLGRAGNIMIERVERDPKDLHLLRYEVEALRLTRAVELTSTELSALRVMAHRQNIESLPVTDDDRTRVEKALARLLDGNV